MAAYWGCLNDATGGRPHSATAMQQDTAMQAALRSLVADPKPDRPTGWGAVVEDNTGAYWTLYAPEADCWINYAEGKRHYDEIAAVRIVSEGVTA
jgi:hypothetical protein